MRIWPWSRIADLEQANFNLNRRLEDWETEVSIKLDGLRRSVDRANTSLGAILPGLGRVIAKLDPHIARSEQSPEMKAESDRISEEVITRLKAEQAVRDQYGYTPKDDQ